MNREKIVITGLGVLAPNGNNVNEYWSSLVEGKSGISPITYFDSSNHRVKIAGELSGFNPEKISNNSPADKGLSASFFNGRAESCNDLHNSG